jgi:hypothetical protein
VTVRYQLTSVGVPAEELGEGDCRRPSIGSALGVMRLI